MAVKQAESIGVGNSSVRLGIFNDQSLIDEIWSNKLVIGKTWNSVGNEYVNSFYKKLGTELGALCGSVNANTQTVIANLNTGTIQMLHEGPESRNGYRRWYPNIFYVDSNNSLKFAGGQPDYDYYTSGGKTYDAYNYWSILFDDETKELLWVHMYTTWTSNAGVTVYLNRYQYSVEESEAYAILRNNITAYEPDPWGDNFADVGGGNGNLDITSDKITVPSNPLSFTDTGFIQIFSPTLEQVNALSDYMWEGSFLDNVLKLWNDPMDIIISLSLFPLVIPSAGSRFVHAGNVVTSVRMNYPDSQYINVDCGTLNVENFYNSYLDYDPFTKCEIYLPYIGMRTLSLDDIMGKTVKVVYTVDLLTGSCVANILCNDSVFYTFSGSCASNIPISGNSYTAIVQSAINVGLTVAGSGGLVTTGEIGALASNVMGAKPNVSRSGSLSANVGGLAPQKPYLVFTIPNICLPKEQNKLLGYPIFTTTELSSLSGYTEVETIRLDNVPCTNAEKDEIMGLLKGGVVL